MFFDPTCKPQTETKLPTLEGFIAWLERRPASGAYRYYCADCAIGLYLRSIGLGYMEALRDGHFALLCDWNMRITSAAPHTFGAALERARAALPSHMGTEK